MSDRLLLHDKDRLARRLQSVRRLMVRVANRAVELHIPSVRYQGPEAGQSLIHGVDCSGFVHEVVAYATQAYDIDMPIPRHTNEQWQQFGEYVPYERRRAGDLIFFPRQYDKNTVRIVGHVGIVVSNEYYAHSLGTNNGTVVMSKMPLGQRRLRPVNDDDIHTVTPVGIKRLTLPIGNGRWHVW